MKQAVEVGDLVVHEHHPNQPRRVTRLVSGSWSGKPMVECAFRENKRACLFVWYVDQIKVVKKSSDTKGHGK